jgi:Ser/Thr protein kinase RdoA (MazF antagonist)
MSLGRVGAANAGAFGVQDDELWASGTQREFERLPRRTQIGRLRRLAENALAGYDLPPARLTLIAHLYNTTFRVDTDTGQCFMLRIHRAGTHTVETVGSELEWLAALRRDTTLEVPEPVPARTGALLTSAIAPGLPRQHICVLFRWLPGKVLSRSLTPAHMVRVGAFMARLHEHTARWVPPPGFTRGRVDYPVDAARWLPDPFAPDVAGYVRDLVAETLSPGEAMPVTEALAKVRAAEEALRTSEKSGPPAFALLHADLHYRNLLFAGNTVKAIDFDDCGFGPHLYDHAVMLSELLDRDGYPALRAGLLAGYRAVRTLLPEHEAQLDTFIALRQVQDALWVLEWRIHPALGPDWKDQARRSLARLPALLK